MLHFYSGLPLQNPSGVDNFNLNQWPTQVVTVRARMAFASSGTTFAIGKRTRLNPARVGDQNGGQRRGSGFIAWKRDD